MKPENISLCILNFPITIYVVFGLNVVASYEFLIMEHMIV
jgi:hypothetical protein